MHIEQRDAPDPAAYAEAVRRETERLVREGSRDWLIAITLEGEFPDAKLVAHLRHLRGPEYTMEYAVWDRDDNPPDEPWEDPVALGFTYGRYLLEGCW